MSALEMMVSRCPYTRGSSDRHRGQVYQWMLTILLLFLSGSFGTFVVVFLIAESETALEVFLNFAAVEFVVFWVRLPSSSHPRGSLEGRTRNVPNSFATQRTRVTEGAQAGTHVAIYFVVLSAVFCAYWLLDSCKVDMLRKCSEVPSSVRTFEDAPDFCFVQFNDHVGPSLAFHRGIYTKQEPNWYLESKQWHSAESVAPRGEFSNNPDLGWNFWGGIEPDQGLRLSATMQRAMPYSYKVCHAYGHQDDPVSRVTCEPEHMKKITTIGRNGTCQTLVAEERYNKFPKGRDGRDIASRFNQIEYGEFYCEPAYGNATTGDIIVYTGYRWALLNIGSLKGSRHHGLNLAEFVPVVMENHTSSALNVFG